MAITRKERLQWLYSNIETKVGAIEILEFEIETIQLMINKLEAEAQAESIEQVQEQVSL